jgi:hypothetical protein
MNAHPSTTPGAPGLPAPLPLLARVALGGQTLDIYAEPAPWTVELMRKFGPFSAPPDHPGGRPASQPLLTVHVTVDAGLEQIDSADVHMDETAAGLHLVTDGGVGEFDRAQALLVARINATDAERGAGSLENLVRPTFQSLLIRAGAGLLVHGGSVVLKDAAGVDTGLGVLWPGYSGQGKTTLSRLAYEAGHTLLSDDLSVVLQQGGRYMVCGSPFYGSEREIPRGTHAAPLVHGFFLRHGPETVVEPLQPNEAARKFLAHIPFVQILPQADVALLIRQVAALTKAVPFAGFPFRPLPEAPAAIAAHVLGLAPPGLLTHPSQQ